jgi:hypothetical protein
LAVGPCACDDVHEWHRRCWGRPVLRVQTQAPVSDFILHRSDTFWEWPLNLLKTHRKSPDPIVLAYGITHGGVGQAVAVLEVVNYHNCVAKVRPKNSH